MKILFSSETLYPPIGGADISLITLLNELSKKHKVAAVYIGEKFDSKFKIYPKDIKRYKGMWINVFLNYWKWKKIIKKMVEREKPDLIITQEFFTPAVISATKDIDIPKIAFVRNNNFADIQGYELTSFKNNKGFFNRMDLKFRMQYLFYLFMSREYRRGLKKCNVFSVSRYLKKQLNRFNIKSDIIRPFIDLEKYKTKKRIGEQYSKDYILYIGPSQAKGVKIFLKMVKEMPDKKFLVAGNLSNELKKYGLRNLELAGWTKNMKEVYKKAKLLLVPSVYPDPCPRIVIEAGANGIPSIVSNRGGLPEEVDQREIVLNISDINEWKEKIRMLDNKRIYKDLSKKAIGKSKEFAFKEQYKKFLKAMEDIVENYSSPSDLASSA